MKSLRYIYWLFCLACTAAMGAWLIFVVSPALYLFYTETGFWGVMGLVAGLVVIVFGPYPIVFWHDRPWKKKDRQP